MNTKQFRQRVAAKLTALVRASHRSPEVLSAIAWPELEVRAGGQRIRRAMDSGWLNPDHAAGLARALGSDPAVDPGELYAGPS